MIEFLATEMQGDRVGEYGRGVGFVALIVIGIWFYLLLDGPTRRGPRK